MRQQTNTRDEIVRAADRLFYRRGFDHTSFADIAEAVGIFRGNFYHYFKSKDEILTAVISRRLAETQEMLDGWEIEGDGPVERIRSFIDMLIANRVDIKRYGCPVGTLNLELAKLRHPARTDAMELFTLFRMWLHRQFIPLIGEAEAGEAAMHLLARSQGVATLAATFRDDDFVEQEVQTLHAWLNDRVRGTRQIS